MAQRSAVVASKVGLHARPAAVFVKAVAASGVPVTIAQAGAEPVDAALGGRPPAAGQDVTAVERR